SRASDVAFLHTTGLRLCFTIHPDFRTNCLPAGAASFGRKSLFMQGMLKITSVCLMVGASLSGASLLAWADGGALAGHSKSSKSGPSVKLPGTAIVALE